MILTISREKIVAQDKKSPDPVSRTTNVTSKTPLAAKPLGDDVIQQHRRALLEGVTEITTTGIPGPLCVFGPRAFPVIIDTADKRLTVLVAAAEWNKGRVVAFPHPSYLGDHISHDGTVRLLLNSIRWAAGKKPNAPQKPIRVATRGYAGILETLKTSQIQCTELPNTKWIENLSAADVVVVPLENTTKDERLALEQYVEGGGGLISAALIWGWQQGHPREMPVDHKGNQLVASAGLVWSDGYASTSYGKPVAVTKTDIEFGHYGRMLTALEKAVAGSRQLSKEELEQIDSVVATDTNAIPEPAASALRHRIDSIFSKAKKHLEIPSEKSPLKIGTLSRTLFGMRTHYFLQQPISELHAAPVAKEFPGAVPDGAPRVNRRVTVTTQSSGWRSTGLYAAPGDKITVSGNGEVAAKGFTLQIGCHSDRLWNLSEWKRLPEIIRRFPLIKPSVEIGSALGGLIYVDVPDKSIGEPITLEFSKVIEAPYYVHGVTSAEEWRSKLSALPGPWAELETRNVIISVPSQLIRDLTAPDELMEFWAHVVDACADLATIPHERKRPERFVFDVQISAGYLHSGYPIMGYINPLATEVVDLRHLKTKGGWGFYHELGHNHQKGEWTFEGTTEVTCNLFSLYVLQTLTPTAYTHDAVQSASQAKAEKEYVTNGNFEKWKSDPFVALIMYDEMRKEFGWKPFMKVFAEYRDLPSDKRPKTDDEKRDQWMVRFSHAVARNLGPFFEHWKIPFSVAAKQSISHLPTWMPTKGH